MPFQDNTAVALERVQDLWFPNADLILRAENKLFRVYKHILGARSRVFHEMASFPQPATPEDDTVDGIPVVRLHDSGAEVEVFLRAIFDSSFFMPSPAATDFSTGIGIMRLSHKYDVPYLFRRAISHLESMYPYTLPEMQDFCRGTTRSHITFPFIVDTDLIALRAVSEVGALWMLPVAYYGVCEHSSKALLEAGDPWNALTTYEQQTCLKSQVEFIRATATTHEFFVGSSARFLPSGLSPSGFKSTTGSLILDVDDKLCSDCNVYAEKAFLRAIFDSSFFMPPPAATDFSIVIGVMRLSHKYDVPYLFRRAISHLESMYPHTLPEMQDLCAGTTGCHVTFPFRVDTDLITLRAVSEVGALWILPTAYYGVCAHSPKEFLEAGAPWSALTTHEQQTCLKSQIEFRGLRPSGFKRTTGSLILENDFSGLGTPVSIGAPQH
ncbi:BTB domain-containing protein [Mycena sanguinolenta]|uniref:BTB domain-containing protein n=1 Tax=Mycena sanguinolenta TaxID=230812 RepID=A0A8H6Z2Y6_9AGAR|nr:BTB domain-containing protein [Mycena sanguinolenta]